MEHEHHEHQELGEVEQVPALQVGNTLVFHLDDFNAEEEELGDVADDEAHLLHVAVVVEDDHHQGHEEEQAVDFEERSEELLSDEVELVVNDFLDSFLLVELDAFLDHHIGDVAVVTNKSVTDLSDLLTQAEELEVDETVLNTDGSVTVDPFLALFFVSLSDYINNLVYLLGIVRHFGQVEVFFVDVRLARQLRIPKELLHVAVSVDASIFVHLNDLLLLVVPGEEGQNHTYLVLFDEFGDDSHKDLGILWLIQREDVLQEDVG
mmetsp:Transcript_19632/g.30270  ORF Transcript_19632/g.30270 Transcript_19632/m.30270 type:complete len:264 (-) Transcript_19632:1338-2129(-)